MAPEKLALTERLRLPATVLSTFLGVDEAALSSLPPDPAIIGDSPEILDRIAETGVHLAIWRRARPVELGWIDDLDWNAIDDIRLSTEPEAAPAAISAALADAGYPDGEMCDALMQEIASLAAHFTRTVACRRLRIRLEVVETNACRKFHADMVTARLLTTLSGAATQWIETASPDMVRDMQVGEVGLFKGQLWSGRPAILHRSPPIEGSGATRLLLVIDPAPDNDARAADTGNDKP